MGWFKRMKDNIATPTVAKKETPEGLWHQCKKCKAMMTADEHAEGLMRVMCDMLDENTETCGDGITTYNDFSPWIKEMWNRHMN